MALWPQGLPFLALLPTSPLLPWPLFPGAAHPPPCGGTRVYPGKPQVLGWGPLYAASGSRGRRKPGGQTGQGPIGQGAAGWLPNPLHPPHPHLCPWRPQRDGGGREPAWRTGHPLGRTQDARPEVPSPSQGHRGKRPLGLGLTSSEMGPGTDGCDFGKDSRASTKETPQSLTLPQAPPGPPVCGPTPGGTRPRAPPQGAPQVTGEARRPGGHRRLRRGEPPPPVGAHSSM